MIPLRHVFGLLVAFSLIGSVRAQVPPAEQLLPDDTFAVFTVPDWTKLKKAQGESAWGQLWADPAMKPFRENLVSNFQSDFVKPLEKELGLTLSAYTELLQGQLTFAFLPPKEGGNEFASMLLLLDAKDKSDLLKTKLEELKKKWTEKGKEMRTEKIRDVEFNVVSFSRAEIDAFLQKAFPPSDKGDEKEKAESKEKVELRIGQFKSLLIVSESSKAVEKILARQSGGLVPPLADQAAYQKSHALLFRDSIAHGWLNFKPIYDKILAMAAKEPQEDAPPGMPAMKLEKLLPALGLTTLQTISAKVASGAEGTTFEFFVGAPEAQREGLFKLLTLEKKDSAPPAFVPTDAIKFQRSRIDAQKAFAALEGILAKIDPSLAGLVQLMLQSAGKDQDPNFDLKKNLIGNLGDDFIQYQKLPKGQKPAELAAPPALILIGSPNAPALVDAIRTVASLLPPPLSSEPLKEREFLGRKIYSLSTPAVPGPDGAVDEKAPSTQLLSFTASGGYVAFSADNAILEEYLRSGENPPKPLRGTPGLTEAAQKIGGMESGYFTYDNQAESMRVTMQALKEDPEAFSRTLFFALSRGEGEGEDTFNRFFNLKLLPDYDRIAKYFGFGVASASTTADGFVLKAFGPRPPAMAR